MLLDHIDLFGGGYQTEIRNAFHAKAHELGVNLLFFLGRSLKNPNPASATHNQIYRVATREALDAIVLMSTCLSGYCGIEGVAEIVNNYSDMPICSVGAQLPGVPSIIIDNETGMAEMVGHLVVSHGRRRIAFIAGNPSNPESHERFAAYRHVLQRHQIQFDPALVATGYFVKSGGHSAMKEILSAGVAFDAVVAANDSMALGAMEVLARRGIQIPEDVAVVGFDDLELARHGNPPLSTIRQPFESVAARALQLLLDQIAGHGVAENSRLNTQPVYRHSCGCGRQYAAPRTVVDGSPQTVNEYLQDAHERMFATLSHCMHREGVADPAVAQQLLIALRSDLADKTGLFLKAVKEALHAVCADNHYHRAFEEAIAYLRTELSPYASPRLDSIWYEANTAIHLASYNAQALHRLKIDENYLQLIAAAEQISAALDVGSLAAILTQNLPKMGVTDAFLARYSATAGELEPLLCLIDGERKPIQAIGFPEAQLVSHEFISDVAPEHWLILPLAYEAKLLGIATFKYKAGTTGYHVIRDQISAALHNLQLHQEIVEKTMQHERSVNERLATARRMQSLSVLAGGVAHDLNNVLGPLVALPDVILDELAQWSVRPTNMADVLGDLESIKVASLHAAQTIKDLLTLGRQGQTAKRPLDLNNLLTQCLANGSFRFTQGKRSRTNVLLDLTPETTTVRGSEAHLIRAVVNLAKNADEAMSGAGEIRIKTTAVTLTQPLVGYEAIDPGDYAVLSISDDGPGIPKAELARIFEPFFSGKRFTDQSGTGLGLAIVHGVVKDHEGFLDVVSTESSGTTFCLYLPRVREQVKAPTASIKPTGGKARVLLVDDAQVQLRTARRVLSHFGYTVDTLSSGSQAHAQFREFSAAGHNPYDLVILDMLLNEERDGLEIFDAIRQLFPNQKAILVTGHAPNERVAAAVQQGLNWLAKPYTADELAQAVQLALVDAPPNSITQARRAYPAADCTLSTNRLPSKDI